MKDFIVGFIIGLLMFLTAGCCSIDREDYPNDSCYMAALCSCRHDENPVICSKAWEGCNSINTEKNRISRFDFCQKNYKQYKFSSQRECRLSLNQKGQ